MDVLVILTIQTYDFMAKFHGNAIFFEFNSDASHQN